jgi:RNA polymerase sigma-70 factor (ECF subfamily)
VDKRRFRDIYDEYSKRLYNYALWMTRNKEAAGDIIQDTFVKVWKQPTVPQRDRELEAWLYMIARNTCMDFFRKCSRFSRFRLKYAHETPQYTNSNAEGKLAWEILGRLGEKDRTILHLHLRAGYSYKEIGESLGLTENNVRVKAFRALGKLRKYCAEEFV